MAKGVKHQLSSMGPWGTGAKSDEREERIRESWARAGEENHEKEPEEPELPLTVEDYTGYRSRTRKVKSSWDVSEH